MMHSHHEAHRTYRLLGLLVVTALLIRLAAVLFFYQAQLIPERDFFNFGYETGRVARSITLGHGFSSPLFGETGPTALLPPGYVYLLAGVFNLFGIYTAKSAFAILSLNALFSALTCLPLFFIARKTFGPAVAKWVGWTWAFFPYAIYCAATQVWGDCLSALLLSLIFLIALHLGPSSRLRIWLAFGLLAGLAALTNPAILSVWVALAGWVCYRLRRRAAKWVKPLGAAVFVLVLTVTPWFVRNYLAFDRLILLRDNFWLEVRIGNTGDTSDIFPDWAHPSTSSREMEEFRRAGELNYMAMKRRQALDFITTHQGTFLWLTIRRMVYVWTGFWSLSPGYLAIEPLEPINIVFCTALSLLMLAGLRQAWRQRQAVAIPYALILFSFPLIYYITHPTLDYRHAIDPEIVILAVYAVTKLIPQIYHVSHRSIMTGTPTPLSKRSSGEAHHVPQSGCLLSGEMNADAHN